MVVVAVYRPASPEDDGVILHPSSYVDALRFALRWMQAHPADRVSILSRSLEPLAVLDGRQLPQRPRAQPGNDASGALS